jgi:hypothetical protein
MRSPEKAEVASDLSSFVCCCIGIAHQASSEENWIKMVDNSALVLRVRTFINSPKGFQVRSKSNGPGHRLSGIHI